SDLRYHFKQYAAFGEGNYHFTDQWTLTVGARYYKFDEDRLLTFRGFFANSGNIDVPGKTDSDGVSPRAILSYAMSSDVTFNGQISRGFRLGGINDPLNTPICGPHDAAKYGAVFNTTWNDEKTWNYELGMKSRFMDGRVTFNASVFQANIDDLQANVDAGNCSSRMVVNVPKSRSTGFELELFARPDEHWDFGISATVVDAKLRSTVTTTYQDPDQGGATVTENIGGLTDGNRLPTSPKFQGAASAGYQWDWSTGLKGFANLTWQYVGSSFTQIADQAPPTGCIGCAGAPGFISYGDPSITQFTFNPELPSYSLGNFRIGVRSGDWEAAAYVSNITDEVAFLSLDRERGTRARVGYLTNQPRTIGVTLNKKF
ncbi:MAG: TonB-dependent receptor, partial [Steroidobacteraceae bacterium]